MKNNENLILNLDTVDTISTSIEPSIAAATITLDGCYPWCTITPPVVEYHPLTCTKCGGQVEIKDGFGQCPYCKTSFSATIVIQEN